MIIPCRFVSLSSLRVVYSTGSKKIKSNHYEYQAFDGGCSNGDEGIVFSGAFGGAFLDGDNTYVNPTGSEPWAGFANEDTDLYPLSFTDGGEITFTGATSGSDVDVYFRFEYNPYPDTEPSFNTEAVLTLSANC